MVSHQAPNPPITILFHLFTSPPSIWLRLTQQMLVPMVPGVAPGQPAAVPGPPAQPGQPGQPGMVPSGTPPQGPQGGSPTRAPAVSPQQSPQQTPSGSPNATPPGSLPPGPAFFGHNRSQSPPPMAHHRSQQVPVYAMNRRPAPPNGNVPVYALPSQPPSPLQEPMPREPAPIETEGIMMEPQMGVATPDTPKSRQSGGLSVEIAQELGYLTSVAGAVGRACSWSCSSQVSTDAMPMRRFQNDNTLSILVEGVVFLTPDRNSEMLMEFEFNMFLYVPTLELQPLQILSCMVSACMRLWIWSWVSFPQAVEIKDGKGHVSMSFNARGVQLVELVVCATGQTKLCTLVWFLELSLISWSTCLFMFIAVKGMQVWLKRLYNLRFGIWFWKGEDHRPMAASYFSFLGIGHTLHTLSGDGN